MRDRPNGQIVRCVKARSMFAMRACRKSVMVGMPMNRHQMLSVSIEYLTCARFGIEMISHNRSYVIWV